MKKLLILIFCVLLAACQSKTEYGPCVGLGDKKNPKLTYKISSQNLIVGIIFVELIAPPVIVVADEFYCPIGLEPG